MVAAQGILNRTNYGLILHIKRKYTCTHQQKKHGNFLLLNGLKTEYVEFKKYMVHVKLTV